MGLDVDVTMSSSGIADDVHDMEIEMVTTSDLSYILIVIVEIQI